VPVGTVRRIVELAVRAPSVHNTQPWRWRATGDSLELYADRSRQLPLSDPDGRNLVVSCGTALHHAVRASLALGWSADVARLPDPGQPDLLARVELRTAGDAPGQPRPEHSEVVATIEARRTDRRRFTSWPVPDETLVNLAEQATTAGIHAVAVLDLSRRFRAERIVTAARSRQSRDRLIAAEQQSWVDRGPSDGVPSAVLPAERPAMSASPGRYPPGGAPDPGHDIEGSDGLVVLTAARDEPLSWLRAGEGLSALWLTATEESLSVVPLSQAIEDDVSRRELAEQVLDGFGTPIILVRIGWQQISRSELPATPRRPVDEVLELA
jgi:nitroreductase